MQRPTFLEYKNFRYLKAAALLVGMAVVVHWMTKPSSGEAYGGTWFGYVLGIASALIVFLHAWYGIRKRRTPRMIERRRGSRRRSFHIDEATATRRRSSDRRALRAKDHWRHGGTLQGWLSAHVYFGIALVVLSSLHTGFLFGWNIHTLAYVLMLLVVASGFYGTFAYLRYPRLISANLGDDTLGSLLLKISELDELARLRALDLPDDVNALVAKARHETRISGGLFRQLSRKLSRQPHFCPTEFAVQRVQELGKVLVHGEQPKFILDLYSLLLQKQHLLARARNEISFNARMKFWLYLHAPLSVALLAALLAHVMAMLIYW